MIWKIHHQAVTTSTNLDARGGIPGDVFTADFQSAGRGRLDHTWVSPPGENLMMSAVLDVAGLPPEQVATFPLAVGLAVLRGLSPFLPAHARRALKWPNDVLAEGRKIAGILCERQGDAVIAGIGVNVKQRKFAKDIENRAVSLALLGSVPTVDAVRAAVLSALAEVYGVWREAGFDAIYSEIVAYDALRGQTLAVRQTDDDRAPLTGLCGGIQSDGSLRIGATCVYAGEAHVCDPTPPLSARGFSAHLL